MANTPTTPASVASWMTDEYIEALANKEAKAGFWETAAALRYYVRMRRLVNAIKTNLGSCACCSKVAALERIFAEAEKGEAK